MAVVEFSLLVLPLFLARHWVAVHIPSVWFWLLWRDFTITIWTPYYIVVNFIYSILGKIRGPRPPFRSIENVIDPHDLTCVLCNIKEHFYRNKALTALDFVYPLSRMSEISNNPKAFLLPPEKLQSDYLFDESNLWTQLRYTVKYATYIYFYPFLGPPKDLDVILGPVLPSSTSNSCFNPGYLVGLDKEQQKLILMIRGSSTIGDFGTDIDARPTTITFNTGDTTRTMTVHRGIWAATKCLDTEIRDQIIPKFEELKNELYPNLQLIICGHSLGAGVSSLLGIAWYYGMLNQGNEYSTESIKYNMRCYSFASPPVIDEISRNWFLKNLKDNVYSDQYIITSITNQNDIVTRMSIPGLEDVSEKIKWIGKDQKRFDLIDALVEHVCQTGHYDDSSLTHREFVKEFSKFQSVESSTGYSGSGSGNISGVNSDSDSDSSVSSGNEDINGVSSVNVDETIWLYPVGMVIWRVPELPVSTDLGESHKILANVINIQDTKSRILVFLWRTLIDLFAEFNQYGNYIGDWAKWGENHSHFCKFQLYIMDGNENKLDTFDIFKNMIVNTGAAVFDHAQGQYSGMFGINMISVFKNTKRFFGYLLPRPGYPLIIKIIMVLFAIPVAIFEYFVYRMVGIAFW